MKGKQIAASWLPSCLWVWHRSQKEKYPAGRPVWYYLLMAASATYLEYLVTATLLSYGGKNHTLIWSLVWRKLTRSDTSNMSLCTQAPNRDIWAWNCLGSLITTRTFSGFIGGLTWKASLSARNTGHTGCQAALCVSGTLPKGASHWIILQWHFIPTIK